jgi:hypothetical protein
VAHRQALEQFAEACFHRPRVPPAVDKHIQDVAVLIDGPPEVMTFPLKRQEHFIHTPRVAGLRPPTPECIRLGLAAPPAPPSNRLIRHEDAPGEQALFHVAVAETKAAGQPDAMADDFRWKSVMLVGG